MNTYYIPTTTLNLNNILSSESISPKSFYSLRGFGYPRWFTIPENNLDNAILLYDQPYSFQRPQSDYEDHPLLIEIKTSKKFPTLNNGISYCNHTLYLSPWNTRFIFFSNKNLSTALSLSEHSLETKLVELYHSTFIVNPNLNPNKYSSSTISSEQIPDTPNIEIQNDFEINKMKGLLYGYYIGGLLSTSSKNVTRNNLLQEIRDIFYAILSSQNQSPTDHQLNRLKSSFIKLSLDSLSASIIAEKVTLPSDIEYIIQELTNVGVVFPDIPNLNNLLFSLANYSNNKDENPAIKFIDDEIRKLNYAILSETKPLKISDAQITVSYRRLHSININAIDDIQDIPILLAWINNVLSDRKYNGKTSTFKDILSDEATLCTKDILNDSWDTSPYKTQLNEMRRYVRGQESKFQWNNGIIASLAAVLSKGNDWEQLLSFMKLKGMTDYRWALAFYGTLNGFANLTRDFTDILFKYTDKRYIADTYCEFSAQLLGINPTIGSTSPMNIFSSTKQDEIKPLSTSIPNEISLKHKVMSIWNEIRKGKRNQKKLEEGLNNALLKFGDNNNTFAFITLLNDYTEYGWDKNKRPWIELQKRLVPDYETQKIVEKTPFKTEQLNIQFENTLDTKNNSEQHLKKTFSFENINLIIDVLIKEFPVLTSKLRKGLTEDLEWILDPKYIRQFTSSAHLLDNFKNRLIDNKTTLRSKKGKDLMWKVKIYQDIDVDKIIDCIKTNFSIDE